MPIKQHFSCSEKWLNIIIPILFLIILKVKKQGIILTEDLVDFLLLNNGYCFIMKTEQKQR